MQLDFRARRGCFDRIADGYADARPPYPARVFEILTGACGLRPGARVLEVGPGSGQATAGLLAAGADVVAVEPGRRLAALLRQRCSSDRLRVIKADVSRWPAECSGQDAGQHVGRPVGGWVVHVQMGH